MLRIGVARFVHRFRRSGIGVIVKGLAAIDVGDAGVVDDQADENADDNENNLKVNKYHFIRLMDILVEAV